MRRVLTIAVALNLSGPAARPAVSAAPGGVVDQATTASSTPGQRLLTLARARRLLEGGAP